MLRAAFPAFAILVAAPAPAQNAAAPTLLNEPSAGWNVYGPGQT